MNMRRYPILLLLCLALFANAAFAASDVVISQVYGGGGSGAAGTAYTNDYVELFNRGDADASIGGYSLQYGSSTGQFGGSGNIFTFPTTTIAPGKYLLVKLGGTGTAGAAFTADLTSTGLSMSAASGKVALATTSSALGCGATATPCTLPNSSIVDVVAWGAANNGEGGTSVNNGATLNSTNGGIRKLNGCQDTNDNNADFLVATTASGLTPRTSATAAQSCAVTNNPPTITPPANPAATVNKNAAPFTVNLTGNDDGGVYNWSATSGAGVSVVSVSGGQGTANVTYQVTLQTDFVGDATFTASLSDTVNNPATTVLVRIDVNDPGVNNPPSITAPADPITSVEQNAPAFAVSLIGSDDFNVFNWSASPGTGIVSVTVSGGQGTANVTYTVLLSVGLSGTASFTASLSDGVNAAQTRTVNINVVPPPPPLDHLVISQIYGGGGNPGATYSHDFVELFNPTTDPIDVGGWTVQYASATGTFWQAQPLGGVIQPGEYYLIRLGTSNSTIGSPLPEANVSGSINMSGTTGKVALVQAGDPLDGCTPTDPTVVDFVGYGTANCREGATNAPAPSNTTTIFRKAGGFTDTNVNGNDFVTGTPNPRRTAAITEIGPYVLTTDPRRNATTAARDSSISVSFTEPVEITGTWYDINCVTTGNHNDATIAGGPTFWVITTNVNFLAGEQCSVTIFKDSVRDVDMDDSLPNTDTLIADYTWTFTVATGTAPPEPASVHLLMGNPTDAMADINLPQNFLMEKPEYALSYNRDRGTPNWVSWHLSDEWIGTLVRVDTFRPDPQVPPDWYRVQGFDYMGSGFDRGHLVPNADRDPQSSIPINQATFLMTNMMPQSPNNNQGPWANLENDLRALMPANELYIIAGPAGTGGTGSAGFMNTVAGGRVTVPAFTWKVALIMPKDSGNDAARVNAQTRTLAVIMPNVQGISSVPWQSYLTTIDQVELLTGYDFFSNIDNAIQACIEGTHYSLNDAPCISVSGPSSSTEGSAVSYFADAVDPEGDPSLTYVWTVTKNGSPYPADTGNTSFTLTPDDNASYVISLSVNDSQGATSTTTRALDVTNVAPEVTGVSGPAGALQVGSSATVHVRYTDAGSADTHTALFSWDDGSSSNVNCAAGLCTASRTYPDTGVYGVTITITDDDGGAVSTSFNYVVIVNQNDAKITGGGWINSPAGAYAANPAFSGKASFNVNSTYQKGVPAGSSSFTTGAFEFVSTTYDWIVTNGANGQYTGTGTLNGAAGYRFLVTVLDADVSGAGKDRYRIRIWNTSTGVTVYDNVPGSPDDMDTANPQPIGGGNIKIH